MKVNNQKFNDAIHHPLYTAGKIKKIIVIAQNMQRSMSNMKKEAKDLEIDLQLYRQELLGAIEEKEG